jgi:hypothetical protein
MMKALPLALLFVAMSLLVGCNAHSAFVGEVVEPILSFVPAPTAHASAGSTALHIVSIDEESSARSSRSVEQNEFELWLMPVTYRGNEVVSHDNVRNIKRFVVTGDDPFAIPVFELPQSDKSIVFIVQLNEEQKHELVGFLTLRIAGSDQPLIVLPPRTAITGDVEFGTVSVSDDSYLAISTETLENNEASFDDATYTSLTQQTILDNLVLMAVNTLWNTDPTGNFYAPGLLLEYELEDGEIVWNSAELWVYSDEYEKHAAIFNPAGENVNNGRFPQAYGPQSSVQWSASLSLEDMLETAQKGALWGLVDEDGTQLAAFDFSVAFVLDNQGKPIIPYIDPTYSEYTGTDGKKYVDKLYLNWYYPDANGGDPHLITEDSELANLISQNELYMDINYPEGGLRGTYMIRDRRIEYSGAYGMEGDIFCLENFDVPLPVAALSSIYNVGYRFALYGCSTPMKARLSRR